mgnify:CR=1 FL=1
MIRRPPRSTLDRSSAASDVYKRQQKYRNVEGDPRVTITVFDADNPYRYVEARGRVVETETGDVARANIDELAQKYTGADYANPIGSERVIVRIGVDHVHKNGI